MNPSRSIVARLLVLLSICSAMAGCSVVGPKAISSGRLAYNEAITQTDNQQMLMVLLHNRYGERGHLLTVSSVTANVSVTTSAGIQAGFGNTSDYRGNLVPFTGGFVYEENPTISYVPVAGERYLRQLTTPIPITLMTQINRSLSSTNPALVALVSQINGIYNPDFFYHEEDNDPRFMKVVSLIGQLTRAHRLTWVETDGNPDTFSIVIDNSNKKYAHKVHELLSLLKLPKEMHGSAQIVIPVSMALDSSKTGAIGITTRSVWDLVEILTAQVDVPKSDELNGVVADMPPPGTMGKLLKVKRSEDEPEHAYIAVEFRDQWFYIDDRDLITKEYFRLLGSLWSLTMANVAERNASAPVLTVPVTR